MESGLVCCELVLCAVCVSGCVRHGAWASTLHDRLSQGPCRPLSVLDGY